MNSIVFNKIPDSVVFLRVRGVIKQAAVFERNGKLQAQYSSGFVELFVDNRTSAVCSWQDLYLATGYEQNVTRLDYLTVSKTS